MSVTADSADEAIRRNADLIGSTQEVLVERFNPSTSQWVGHTSQNRTLNFTHPAAGTDSLAGSYVNVRVTRSGPNSLVGESCPADYTNGKGTTWQKSK